MMCAKWKENIIKIRSIWMCANRIRKHDHVYSCGGKNIIPKNKFTYFKIHINLYYFCLKILVLIWIKRWNTYDRELLKNIKYFIPPK